jgi:hypothetical protein
VQAGEELRRRRLAGPGLPDQRDPLAGRALEVDADDHGQGGFAGPAPHAQRGGADEVSSVAGDRLPRNRRSIQAGLG